MTKRRKKNHWDEVDDGKRKGLCCVKILKKEELNDQEKKEKPAR